MPADALEAPMEEMPAAEEPAADEMDYAVEPEALTLTAYDPGAGLGDYTADQAQAILASVR